MTLLMPLFSKMLGINIIHNNQLQNVKYFFMKLYICPEKDSLIIMHFALL